MGSGASTPKDALRPLLLSQELIDCSCKLVGDASFRTSFTQYLKSGVWMDCLARLVPDTRCVCNTVSLVPTSDDPTACLLEYNLDESRLTMLKCFMRNEKSATPLAGSPVSSVNSRSFRSDEYVHPDNISSFTQDELLNVLFTITVPIYLSSREYARFVEYGMEEGGSTDGDSNKFQNTKLVQTSQSKRAQELLLGSAAFYDESFLQDYLLERSWLDRVCPIFHDHPVPLCFTNAAKVGSPIIVFANKAFCRMFSYAEAELVGQHFSMLSGVGTEAPQLTLMHNSIRSTETVKFAITLQSKSKKPLFDLVAQKAVGSYSISAHFAKSKHSHIESLNMVDDVLILLSYLLIVPALPVPRSSWLPVPIAIMAKSATNALHSSPSHTRKFIPSRSRSHSQDKTERTDQSTSRAARSYGLKNMLNSLSFSGSGSGSNKGNISVCREASIAKTNAASAGHHGAIDSEATVEFSLGEPTRPRSDIVG